MSIGMHEAGSDITAVRFWPLADIHCRGFCADRITALEKSGDPRIRRVDR
jgi:hypothetical protein